MKLEMQIYTLYCQRLKVILIRIEQITELSDDLNTIRFYYKKKSAEYFIIFKWKSKQ